MVNFPSLQGFDVKQMVQDPWPFVSAWVFGAVLSVIVPVLRWNGRRKLYYNYVGYQVEYEQAQRAYEEANNQNNNNNNNNGNYYCGMNCSWWNWGCKMKQNRCYQNYNNNRDNNDENDINLPNWYYLIGGTTEEDERDREERGQSATGSTGVLKFVYWWSLLLFIAIVAFGVMVLVKKQQMKGLLLALMLFAQFALMNMFLMGQGVIKTDGRDMEDSIYGWYGQLGVLIVYQDLWFVLYSFFGSVALVVRAIFLRRHQANSSNETEEESTTYQKYDEPKVSITNAENA